MADINSDILIKLQAAVTQLGELVRAFKTAFPINWNIGSFAWPAAATVTVADTTVTATCHVNLTALNAAAANMVAGVTSPYISARVAGVSFTLTTANGLAAVGTEQFSYHLVHK